MPSLRPLAGMFAALATYMSLPAQAAENLDCMDSDYSSADQAVLDDFIAGFSMDSWAQEGVPDDLRVVLSNKAKACEAANAWSPAATQHALLFKIASVGLSGVEATSSLTPAQFGQIKKAMTPADQVRIRAIFQEMWEAQRAGRPTQATAQSADMFIGRLIVRSGIPGSSENAKVAGGWIAANVLRDQYAENFAAD